MKRREFIGLLGAGAAWPSVALAQRPSVPTVGALHGASPSMFTDEAFKQGLRESGYIDGQNVRLEFRWARGDYQRLPALAAELVERRVNVMATFGSPAARSAKSASLQANPPVPVVFALGSDPVADGVVASLNRPGGNITGITSIAASLAPKRMELIREFLTPDGSIALLINPDNPVSQAERRDAEAASRSIGQRLEVLMARNEREIEAAFAAIQKRQAAVLIIAVDTYFFVQMQRMASLAAQYRVAAIGPLREFAAEGGLLSYGASIGDVNRQAGVYAGKVLAGVRPADLPVLQATKFELVINLKSAKSLGIELSPKLLALADEVIE